MKRKRYTIATQKIISNYRHFGRFFRESNQLRRANSIMKLQLDEISLKLYAIEKFQIKLIELVEFLDKMIGIL